MSPAIAIFLLVFLSIIIGYLLGSIMTSDVVGKFIKNSARLYWSKNPGTTNSIRVYGIKNGVVVAIGDIAKSFLSFLITWLILQYGLKPFLTAEFENIYYLVYLANFFAIIGHCWPLYHKFKGGKAAAPTVGFLLSISFWWFLIILIVWVFIVWKTKYVSLASLVSATLLPILNLIFYLDYLNFFCLGQSPFVPKNENIGGYLTYLNDWQVIVFLEIINILIATILFWKHRSNIKRLLNKNENKIGKAKPQIN